MRSVISLIRGLLSIIKGLWVTFINLFRRPITLQYPYQRWSIPPGYRGRHALILDKETGKERCIACGLCARGCPAHCVEVKVTSGEDGKKRLEEIIIDLGMCMYCGLCQENCPQGALVMTDLYELADYDRGNIIYNREKLKARNVEAKL
ncbi:MAG: NADH-quinone oxidoreductase subunit I [Armatimonadetes bacterium CG07_land_8_20_14_0_80_40_9]|nr:MAG: NADH-quinone oxidoreductase subunit I [Armatimonadetes bacterium CG07_land_8_20_14_0_80_40_9]